MNAFAECRKRAGLTQAEAAELLQVERSTVAKWEIGAAMPRAETLRAVAKTYQCSLEELLACEKAV